MAPKKDPKKGKNAVEEPEFASLFAKREPLPQQEPPDVSEAEVAWKAGRNNYVLPLARWDDEAVNTADWKPNETDTLFTDSTFSGKSLPKTFSQQVSTWKRAAIGIDPAASEEPEPQSQPLPDLDEPPPEKVDPKAKSKPDAKAKAKPGKAGAEEVPGAGKTTAQQFADLQYSGEVCVVSVAEFRSREVSLSHDDALPPLSQAIASHFAIVAEHRRLLPKGCFLWELIYPQDEEGIPLYNPHGKYIVKLFVQGQWRQVLVDDIVPFGVSTTPQTGHATVLPSSNMPNAIWPQLLAKALLRAFQADLKCATTLPAITSLTGWLPFQLPLTWDAVCNSHSCRAFCCLPAPSSPDIEARQREALAVAANSGPGIPAVTRPGMPSVPALNLENKGPPMLKLGGSQIEASLQFLICELEGEPRQIRMKAGNWRPVGGTPRKVVLREAESEGEEEDEEVQRRAGDEVEEDEEHEEQDNEEDEEDRKSQQSPSGGEPAVQSARSKEDGGAAEEGEKPPDGQEGGEEAALAPWHNPWPDVLPAPMLWKSDMTAYYAELQNNGFPGYWSGFDALAEGGCTSFISYMPPGDRMVKALHDSSWAADRKQAFAPSNNRLLRIRISQLPPSEARSGSVGGKRPTTADNDEDAEPRGPPWHRAVFIYEPLQLDPILGPGKDSSSAAVGSNNCLLQSVSQWQPSPPEELAVDSIHFSVSEGSGTGQSSRSVLLPPGEHWYLVCDDASRAGSTLSVYVEGMMHLNMGESMIDFVEPAQALEEKGMSVATLEPTLYPAQKGFSVWAKAEVTLAEGAIAASAEFLQLLSFVSDPVLRPHLTISFLELIEGAGSEPDERAAGWSVTTLMRSPLMRLMSLPLNAASRASRAASPGEISPKASPKARGTNGGNVKYVVMLEASVPFPVRGGNFALQLLVPPGARPSSPVDASAQEAPLVLNSLKADHVMRWAGETAPNDHRLVLCERLTVPMGSGDVTAMLRVAVGGLPQAFLRAALVAQLPPREEMRPKKEGGESPDPLVPGAPVDPRDYGGRRNWLSCCKTVVEESGVEVVVFPHVILCEGSTYLFYVHLDPFKGPDKLEEGTWQIEMYGSGVVDAGADSMEKDLEVLVRKSWEEPPGDAAVPPRQERANAARTAWLKKRGLLEEEAPAEGEPTPAAEPAEEEVTPEALVLQAALKRAEDTKHCNVAMYDYLHLHTAVEPVLVVQDPYTIVPDPPMKGEPAEVDELEGVAHRALGMLGLQEVLKVEVETSKARWETAQEEMVAAKEKNKSAIEELKIWCEEHTTSDLKFLETRDALRGSMQSRFEKYSRLKDAVEDADADLERLRRCFDEAEQVGVGVWDSGLMETGGQKISFFESFATLKETLEKTKEEPMTDPAAREEFGQSLAILRELLKTLASKKVPLPADSNEEDVLSQADEILKEPVPAEEAQS